MMMTVWKFELDISDFQDVAMPIGAKILRIATQFERPCLWALVNPLAEKENRKFRIIGTGHRAPKNELENYLDSFTLREGTFVFHVFEQK